MQIAVRPWRSPWRAVMQRDAGILQILTTVMAFCLRRMRNGPLAPESISSTGSQSQNAGKELVRASVALFTNRLFAGIIKLLKR